MAFLVFSLILFIIGCCTKYRNQHSRYLVRFPGHSFKWLIASLLFVVLMASLGEGVLTDQSYRIAYDFNTQPSLLYSTSHGYGGACIVTHILSDDGVVATSIYGIFACHLLAGLNSR